MRRWSATDARPASCARTPRRAGRSERGDAAWRDVEALAEAKLPAQYDKAVTLLKDLELLADRDDGIERFHQRLDAFRERHRRKPSLLSRLAAAGLARPAR